MLGDEAEHVFDVDDADDVVDRLAVDRETAVAASHYTFRRSRAYCARLKPDGLGARHHDFADTPVVEAKDAVHQLGLLFADSAFLRADIDEHP